MADQVVENVLAIIPDACPLWINYLAVLHLAVDTVPFNAQVRILDAAFKYGYVKAQDPKPPAALLPVPVFPAAPPQPAPPPPAQVAPLSARAAEKRKAPDPAPASPPVKKRALDIRVDFTQTQRPSSHKNDSWYKDLSIKYLTAVFTNLPLH